MKRFAGLLVLVTLFGVAPALHKLTAQEASPAQTSKVVRTDAEIKQEIIRQSIAGYSGSCPCPYNTDRAGRRCGRRSAYSRPGGESPLCYEGDVSKNMVDSYRVAGTIGRASSRCSSSGRTSR